ncbi:PASTA domain-containing protein [Marinilongibacter aquaticus]|uniref:PASTA domain-containing protein n=1 Tax=Marinilongibacter aquaticus TaxID=2975157 RepID=UPI0021BD2633|nr:PASTA domain-containing protein [Marinilongibacter aquaticus]UBM58885.1 PASTA domain-containing protein [Marinilongibacter aquaticus]
MPKLSTNTKSDLLVHIGILFTAGLALLLVFFFLYLPWATNHDETLKVPDLKGLSIEAAEDALDSRGLSYEVSDSTFVAGLEPLSVHSQYPKPDATVKKGRKVFLTIITNKVPKVSIPDVVGRSVNSARNLLSSVGLQVEQVEYIPAIEKNTVLKIKFENQEVPISKTVPKGSKLVLVAGDGLGNTIMNVPDLVGMSKEEAELTVAGSSLNLGNVLIDNSSNMPAGTVVRQRPDVGSSIRVGEEISIWVSGN